MKKKLAVLAFVATAIGAWTPSWAFQLVQIETVTATAVTGGAKVARFNFVIRDAANVNGPNRPNLGWSGVDPLSTQWKMSDQVIVMASTVTDAAGGIQIHTDNTAADASPKFVDPTPGNLINPDSNAAGLLQGTSGVTSTVLPMAWSIKDSSRTVESGTVNTGIGAADPNNGPITAVYNTKYQWLFVTDKFNVQGIDYSGDGLVTPGPNSPDAAPFVNGAKYITMRNSTGIHFGQADGEFASVPQGQTNYVYFEANFLGSQVQQTYQTTTLRLEAFIQ